MNKSIKPNKAEFVKAYCYSYGESKAKAELIYKYAEPAYISAIIAGYKQDAKSAFYKD
jgi:methionine salvage enolase-phosphatase E1